MKVSKQGLEEIIEEELSSVLEERNLPLDLEHPIEDYLDVYKDNPLDINMPYEVAMHPRMLKARHEAYKIIIDYCMEKQRGLTPSPTRQWGFEDDSSQQKPDTLSTDDETGTTSGTVSLGGPPLKQKETHHEYAEKLMAYMKMQSPCSFSSGLRGVFRNMTSRNLERSELHHLRGEIISNLEKDFFKKLTSDDGNKRNREYIRRMTKRERQRERDEDTSARRRKFDLAKSRVTQKDHFGASGALGRTRQRLASTEYLKEKKMKFSGQQLKKMIKEELNTLKSNLEEEGPSPAAAAAYERLKEIKKIVDEAFMNKSIPWRSSSYIDAITNVLQGTEEH